MPPLLDDPVVRLYVIVYVLLVLKMAVLGTTSDEDIERVRRAHRNDLENILPFFVVGLLFLLTRPSWTTAAIYLIGYLIARVAHRVFYVRGMQPHRTIAFALGGVLTLAMIVQTLVAVARAG